MTDSLIIEHFKKFHAALERIEHKLDEHTTRLGRIEVNMARFSSAQSYHDEAYAGQSVRMDHLVERIERIERRLELS